MLLITLSARLRLGPSGSFKVWPYHCWRSGSFTLATTSAAGGAQGQFIGLRVPPSSSSIISGWDVRSCFSNRQPMSPPLCNTRRPGSSTNQIDKIRKIKFFLCLVRCCATHYHWLTVMYHWHWLSSTHDWRLFCFPEPTGHHHSASVTVSAVKFVCANTNLLTYLQHLTVNVMDRDDDYDNFTDCRYHTSYWSVWKFSNDIGRRAPSLSFGA